MKKVKTEVSKNLFWNVQPVQNYFVPPFDPHFAPHFVPYFVPYIYIYKSIRYKDIYIRGTKYRGYIHLCKSYDRKKIIIKNNIKNLYRGIFFFVPFVPPHVLTCISKCYDGAKGGAKKFFDPPMSINELNIIV